MGVARGRDEPGAAARLQRFDVEAAGPAFVLTIEDDQGRTIRLSASRDQLDLMADALDDVLLHDGSDDEAP